MPKPPCTPALVADTFFSFTAPSLNLDIHGCCTSFCREIHGWDALSVLFFHRSAADFSSARLAFQHCCCCNSVGRPTGRPFLARLACLPTLLLLLLCWLAGLPGLFWQLPWLACLPTLLLLPLCWLAGLPGPIWPARLTCLPALLLLLLCWLAGLPGPVGLARLACLPTLLLLLLCWLACLPGLACLLALLLLLQLSWLAGRPALPMRPSCLTLPAAAAAAMCGDARAAGWACGVSPAACWRAGDDSGGFRP